MANKYTRTLDVNNKTSIKERTVGNGKNPNERAIGRMTPVKSVVIEKKDLSAELLDNFITEIIIEESAYDMPYARIFFHNFNTVSLVNEGLFDTYNKVYIWTGYVETDIEFRGAFRIGKLEYDFNSVKSQTCCLHCYGEEIDLSYTERREVYKNKSDAQIAIDIASRYNLLNEVDATLPVNRQVTQVNENDMQFLNKRAMLYGYDCYVLDGVLHFHRPRYYYSNIFLGYDIGDSSLIKDFNVNLDTWYRNVEWQASKVNPLTKERYLVKSNPDIFDPVQQKIIDTSIQLKPLDSIVELNKESRPKRYMIGEGHWQTKEESQKQVQTFSQFTKYMLRGTGSVGIGIETLHARQVVTILGIGRFTGDYYMTKVYHNYVANGYNVAFDVVGVSPLDIKDKPLSEMARNSGTKFAADALVLNRKKIINVKV